MIRPPPRSTPFPYPTLFRSQGQAGDRIAADQADAGEFGARERDCVTVGFTAAVGGDRKSTRLNSSHSQISYAVFCLKKKRSLLVVVSYIQDTIDEVLVSPLC